MNTSTPLDPRSLAHRLTTVGHALHHRLATRLHDADIDPRTVLILRTIDGELDAPWIADRIARGGGRIRALADRGWIARNDGSWSLTDDGRAALDRVDAIRDALRDELAAAVPEGDIAAFAATLDAVADALGVDDVDHGPGFGPAGGFGPGRGFDPDGRRGHGFGPGFRGGFPGAFGPGFRPGFGPGFAHGHDHGADERGDRRGRGDRAAQRAYERGFDAGFTRGRDASASA